MNLFSVSAVAYKHQLFSQHQGKSFQVIVKDLEIQLQFRIHQSGMLTERLGHKPCLRVTTDLDGCVQILQQGIQGANINYQGDRELAVQLKKWLQLYPQALQDIAAIHAPSTCFSLTTDIASITKSIIKNSWNACTFTARQQLCYEWGITAERAELHQLIEESLDLTSKINHIQQKYTEPCLPEPDA